MPIRINSVNFDRQEFVYSLVDASGNVYLDHVQLTVTTEQSIAELKATAQIDAQAKKPAVKQAYQDKIAVMQNQVTALNAGGLP